jgi:quinol-cytochrome oxidoreductase complex cytochrome b subunit
MREWLRRALFPVHWSVLLSHLALWSFVVLLLTGLVLTVFYRPSLDPVVYAGSAELYDGQELPAAYASVVRLSEDVPGGLLLRRVHRAASHLFLVAIVAHVLRVLVSAGFRRRAGNYVVGLALGAVALGLGYTGQNLPFELLAGTSLRVGYSLLSSIPWIGPDLALLVYGGEFPGGDVVWRFWLLHVLVLPVLFVAGVLLHLALVVRRGHQRVPTAPGSVTRAPLARSGLLGVLTAALVVGSAAVVPWSDVLLQGPYRVGQASNDLQPDWFLFWPEGAMRILPAIDVDLLGTQLSNAFVAGVALPATLLLFPLVLPLVDQWRRPRDLDLDVSEHPLDAPVRLGFVVAWVTVLAVLAAGATDDVVAAATGVPVETIVPALRVALVVLPVALGLAAWAYARAQGPRWRPADEIRPRSTLAPAPPAAEDVQRRAADEDGRRAAQGVR